MGIGQLGSDAVVLKRKFRWTLELQTCAGKIPADFVKMAARPNLTIEETEINHLNAKTWVPGKGTWETITVTYYDVGGNGVGAAGILLGWLSAVYGFHDPDNLPMSSKRGNGNGGGYAGIATLKLYDGCGTEMEKWEIKDAWPQAINFGELDYSSSEEVTIELTMRYSQVKYSASCGVGFTPCNCSGC
jgi:hypothetical protein